MFANEFFIQPFSDNLSRVIKALEIKNGFTKFLKKFFLQWPAEEVFNCQLDKGQYLDWLFLHCRHCTAACFQQKLSPSSTKRRIKPVNLGEPCNAVIRLVCLASIKLFIIGIVKIILLLYKNTISESVVTTLISIKSIELVVIAGEFFSIKDVLIIISMILIAEKCHEENYLEKLKFRVECAPFNELFLNRLLYVGFDDYALGCRQLENEPNAGRCQAIASRI